MLKHFRDLLSKVLDGDKKAWSTFKLSLQQPGAPNEQQIADFFFREHTLKESAKAILNIGEFREDIAAWYMKKFTYQGTINYFLIQLRDFVRYCKITDATKRINSLNFLVTRKDDASHIVKALAFHQLGLAYFEQAKFKEAVEHHTEAIKLAPYCAEFYHTRGNANWDWKNASAALADFQMSVSLHPNAGSHNNAGVIYHTCGLYEQAISQFLSALALKPADPDYYYNLGQVYESQSKFDLAIQYYNEAINRKVEPEFYERLARVQKTKRDFEEIARLKSTEPQKLAKTNDGLATPVTSAVSVVQTFSANLEQNSSVFFPPPSRNPKKLSVSDGVGQRPPTQSTNISSAPEAVVQQPVNSKKRRRSESSLGKENDTPISSNVINLDEDKTLEPESKKFRKGLS